MFKRVLIASALAAAFAVPAMAEVSISGSAEMDFFYRTNNTSDGKGKFLEEIAVVINVDGKDKLDTGDTLSWRLAQKVATDYRFDGWGVREAWVAYGGNWGTLKFGNQFSNLYLTLDWPYGVKGTGNLWADYGAHEVQYARGVGYSSPNFGGFDFAVQYDLGNKDATASAYAWEAVANFSAGGFAANAGYYEGRNSNFDTEADVFGGSKSNMSGAWGAGHGWSVDYGDNKASVAFLGARYSFGDFSVRAGYKHNEWKDVVADNTKNKNDQWLVGGTYGFGKNALSLSYQQITDMKFSGDLDGKLNNGVQQIAFQWDYALSKNTGAFLQVRHNMFDSAPNAGEGNPAGTGGGWQIDGYADPSKKSVTRVLVGTWTGF